MKSIHLLALIFLQLSFVGCALTQRPHFQTSTDYYKHADSLSQKYQKESYNTKRTFAYLKPVLDSIALDITEILNDNQFKGKINFKSISFFVLPSGIIRLGNCSHFTKPDSTIEKAPDLLNKYFEPGLNFKTSIERMISKFRTASLPDYKPNLVILGNISEDSSGYNYRFKDTSYYRSSLTGGRSKASIMRIVMKGLPDLKYVYNQRLRTKQGLAGRITVKFAINEFGRVIFAELVPTGTTLNDEYLCDDFLRIVKSWKFDRIRKEGDVTEVVYPFVFSQ